MASHLTTAVLLLPSQVMTDTPFAVDLIAGSDGTAVTILGDVNAVSNEQAGNYQDIGTQNDSIVGLVVPASGSVSGNFPMTVNADSAPNPLNIPVNVSFLTSDGFMVPASNNGQTITVVSPVNAGSLPGAPSSLVAAEATAPANSVAIVSFGASVPGTGDAYNPLPLPPAYGAGTGTAAITGYVAVELTTGKQSALAALQVVSPAHSAWTGITTSASIKINGSAKISLGSSGMPSVALAVTNINAAAVPGIQAFGVGAAGAETLLILSTGALSVIDGGDVTNGLTVIGYAGPPASVAGVAATNAVIEGLTTGIAYTFVVYAVSPLGNSPWSAASTLTLI